MRVAHWAVACVIVTLVVPVAVWGAQYIVSQDGSGGFRTIQGAVNAAAYGDVIYVSPGVYEEHVAFRDGLTLIGAGAAQTIVRYAYGFDEVLLVEQVSSGRIEGLTIQRAVSILDAPTVLVSAGSLVMANCVVSGGAGSGVEVRGSTSTLALEAVTVVDNGGHGVWVHDRGRLVLQDCVVRRSEGAGILIGNGSSVRASDSTFEQNGAGGVVLNSDAEATLDRCRITDHLSVGLLATDNATLVARDVELSGNDATALRLADDASAALTRPSIRRGGDGVVVEDRGRLAVEGGAIHGVGGTAVRVVDEAVASIRNCEVVEGAGDGIVLATAASCALTYSTVIRNSGDGVRVSGGDARVDHTILAYNGDAGLRVSDAAGSAAVRAFSHNCVWGNGNDYVGTSMRPSDVAEAPTFVDLASGNVSLRLDSPCIEAGSAWSTIGAHSDPSASHSVSVDLLGTMSPGWFGETWRAELRATGSPLECEALEVGFLYEGGTTTLSLTSTVLGTWARRAWMSGSGETSWSLGDDERASVSLRYGFAGALAGAESWASIWGTGSLDGAAARATVELGTNWPSSHMSSRLAVDFDVPVRVGISVAAVDFTLTSLHLAASQSVEGAAGALRFYERLQMLPDPTAEGTVTWSGEEHQYQASVEIATAAWRASVAVDDRSLSVEGRVRFLESAFSEGTLSAAVLLGALRLSAQITLTNKGTPSIATSVHVDISRWLRRSPNEPPLPTFTVEPIDPEAGSAVRFSAAASRDPDGEIREFWWDFGDGSAAFGPSADHTYTSPGAYDVALTVSDDRGDAATLRLPTVIWPADTSPVASFVAVPISEGGVRIPRALREGDRVLLDASESVDRDGAVVEYGWDLESDGVVDVVTADSITTIPSLSPGAHPVTLRVLDDTSRSDAVMRVLYVDRVEPPRADFVFTPPTPAIQDPVYFSDRSSDTDGDVVVWRWDFGDGQRSRDPSPVHRFEAQGEFVVTLDVLDSDGLASTTSRRIVVSPTPEIVTVDEVWALVIGISDYAQVKDLQYGRDDATAMARWLLDAGVPQDHIRLLLDSDGAVGGLDGLASGLATLVNVREALGWLRRVAGPNDLVFVSFSGHGFQGDDDDGDEKDGVDEFFVLYDTVALAPEDTALRDDEFGRFLNRLESNHVLVFFDGCYSGGLSRSLPASKRPIGNSQDLFSDFSLEGRLVFSAAAESQDAFESSALGHGIFTYFVVAGLRGAADVNGDYRVTAWELYEYVARTVPDRARLERGVVQEPQLLGAGEVRVLLAKIDAPPVVGFSYRPDVPYAGGAVEFFDQSRGDRALTSFLWTFGDGATSAGSSASHVYDAPGSYVVDLHVTDDVAGSGTATSFVAVSSAGHVLSVDSATGIVLISLGSENGVRPGDRFQTPKSEEMTLLAVIEVVGPDSAACQLVRGAAPAPGVEIRPVSPGERPTPPTQASGETPPLRGAP